MQGQEDFVRNYAAKRAAQMERARALREQREQQRGGTGAPSGYQQQQYQAPPQPVQQQQQQQYHAPQASHHQAPLPQRAQDAPRRDYPPPVQQQQQYQAPPQQYHQPPPQQYQQQQQQQQQQQYAAPSHYAPPAPTASSRRPDMGQPSRASQSHQQRQAQEPPAQNGAVTISESDFQRAVALGVISGEQARQLWTVVSSGGGAPAPAPAPARAPAGDGAYDPNMFAPASAPASDARRQQKQQQAQPVRHSVSSSNRRPEWNSEPATGDVGLHQEDSDSHYDAPPPRQSGQTPGRASRPQINGGGRQQPSVNNGDWNADPEPTDGGFGAPPPIPGRRQKNPVREEPSNTPRRVDDIDSMPVGGRRDQKADPYADAYPTEAPPPAAKKPGLAPGAAARIAKGRRAGAPSSNAQPEDDMPPPPPPPANEVEEMERQKAEAKARLDAELAEAAEAAATEPMEECRICGRNFRGSIIDRHEVACEKANKKRKAFNTKDQRLGEVAQEAKQAARNAKLERKPTAERPAGKMPKWKVQHEQFQAAMQAVSGARKAEATGGPMPVPVAAPDDRVPCPHCNRKFAQEVADRHIPKCKTTLNRPRAVGARR